MNQLITAKFNLQGVSGLIIQETTLVSCSHVPEYLSIPIEVTELGDGCLSGQDLLRVVVLSNPNMLIGKAPFGNCCNLVKIVAPKELRKYDSNLKKYNNAEVVYGRSCSN